MTTTAPIRNVKSTAEIVDNVTAWRSALNNAADAYAEQAGRIGEPLRNALMAHGVAEARAEDLTDTLVRSLKSIAHVFGTTANNDLVEVLDVIDAIRIYDRKAQGK